MCSLSTAVVQSSVRRSVNFGSGWRGGAGFADMLSPLARFESIMPSLPLCASPCYICDLLHLWIVFRGKLEMWSITADLHDAPGYGRQARLPAALEDERPAGAGA